MDFFSLVQISIEADIFWHLLIFVCQMLHDWHHLFEILVKIIKFRDFEGLVGYICLKM